MPLWVIVAFSCNRCKWVSVWNAVGLCLCVVSIRAFFTCPMCFSVFEAISTCDLVCATMIWGQRCSVQALHCPWRNSGMASQFLLLVRIDCLQIILTVYLIESLTVQLNYKVRDSSWVWLLRQRSCVLSDKRITGILHGWFDWNTLNTCEYNTIHLNADLRHDVSNTRYFSGDIVILNDSDCTWTLKV